MKNGKEKSMFVREYLWRDLMTVCGLFVILLTIVIGAFLVYKGSSTFLVYRHSFLEFLGSADWAPEDNMQHRCADLHRWVALHLRPGASHRDSVFPGISDLHHGDLPEVWREILPPGSRDLRRDPVCCLWLGGTHGACTGDQDLV